MKNILFLFLFLIPAFLFAQYPTGTNKSRLGYQTTGDGLIWRGVAADTVIKPRTTANAYFQLDTVNRVLRRYIATQGSWQVVAVTPNLTPYALKTYVDSLYATDHDRDSTNELQTLTFASPLLGISDGNNVDLSPILSGYVTGSGTANYLPKWSAITNLTNSNLFDNNIYVGILNSKPFALGQWATAGRPTGVTGYTGYNTTLGVTEQYNGSTYDQFAMLSKTQTFTGVNSFNNDIYYNNTLKQTTTTAFSLNYLHYAAQSTNHGAFLSFGANGIPTDNMYGMSFGGKATGTDIPAFLLVGSNSHKNNVLALVNHGSSPQNYDFTLQNKTGDWNGSGDYHLVIKQGGAINIGHKDSPAFDVNLKKSRASAHVAYFAQNTSSTGYTSYQLQNNLGYSGGIGKWGSASTAYKTIAANNTYLYNSTEAGNLVLLNDYASGNINFATGGGSTAQMTLASTGNLLLGTTTDVSRRLHVSGEARITDLTTDPPTRIVGADADGDLGAMTVSGGLSITSGVLSSTWLKPQLEAGNVTINAASNADFIINNLDTTKLGNVLIRGRSSSLLLINPNVGSSGTVTEGVGFHTNLNGTINGTNGGTGQIVIGGTVTANSSGSIFNVNIGYANNTNGAYASAFGYNADAMADNTLAVGRNALADEAGEISLGSTNYTKINLSTNTGDIYAKGDLIVEDSLRVVTLPDHTNPDSIATVKGGVIGKKKWIIPSANLYDGVSSGNFFDGSKVGNQSVTTDMYAVMYNGGDEVESDIYHDDGGYAGFYSSFYGTQGTVYMYATRSYNHSLGTNLIMRPDYFAFYNGSSQNLIESDSSGTVRFSQYAGNTKTATALSKTLSTLAGIATDGTVLSVEQKRDTTIYVTDADYNFSAAITSANILKRYNNIIIYSKLSASSTSDNQIFLHTPSSDFLQCTIIIYSNDASADSDATSVDFTSNGAVDGAGGTLSSYAMAAGQRVEIRVADDGGYKWFFN